MFVGNYLDHLSYLQERHQGQSLEDIPNFLETISSLIVRNKHKIKDKGDFAKITGSLEFLEGLEYHYSNFLFHLQLLAGQDSLRDEMDA